MSGDVGVEDNHDMISRISLNQQHAQGAADTVGITDNDNAEYSGTRAREELTFENKQLETSLGIGSGK